MKLIIQKMIHFQMKLETWNRSKYLIILGINIALQN